jgi:hypothetical protein
LRLSCRPMRLIIGWIFCAARQKRGQADDKTERLATGRSGKSQSGGLIEFDV